MFRFFYILPKVHKPGFPTGGLPIITTQGSIHEPVSQYIDSLLQPFVWKIPTFLSDIKDFIRKVEDLVIPVDSLIISFDVVSLYASIPHEELRTTLQEIFDLKENISPPTHF